MEFYGEEFYGEEFYGEEFHAEAQSSRRKKGGIDFKVIFSVCTK